MHIRAKRQGKIHYWFWQLPDFPRLSCRWRAQVARSKISLAILSLLSFLKRAAPRYLFALSRSALWKIIDMADAHYSRLRRREPEQRGKFFSPAIYQCKSVLLSVPPCGISGKVFGRGCFPDRIFFRLGLQI